MDRRAFLKTAAVTVAAAAAGAATPRTLAADTVPTVPAQPAGGGDGRPDVVAVRNGSPVEMFRKGIEPLGGMKAFVKPGQSVVVKPNIGWDRTPEQAANTNPELVAEIVRQALAAGASRVTVFDNTCNEWKACYRNSGIEEAAGKAGALIVSGKDQKLYREESRPGAEKLKTASIHEAILDSDVFINVPVLKHHGGAKMTSAMKNFMGIVWDRQFMHRNNLPQSIADAVLYRRPDLNIVDAYRILVANGPKGVSLDDVRSPKYLLFSRDIVAVDAAATKVIGYELAQVPYIGHAARMGLGRDDLDKLNIARFEL